MKISAAMDEIRKIRDESSLRHLSQTVEERECESKELMEWFVKVMGRPVRIVKKEN